LRPRPPSSTLFPYTTLFRSQYSLDLHCPFLKGDIHEAFHFLGLGVPHIKDNLNEWSAWLKEERPQLAMTPLNLLVDPLKPNAIKDRKSTRLNSSHVKISYAV